MTKPLGGPTWLVLGTVGDKIDTLAKVPPAFPCIPYEVVIPQGEYRIYRIGWWPVERFRRVYPSTLSNGGCEAVVDR